MKKSMYKSIDNKADAPHHVYMEFDWDDGKHAINLEKHRVDFVDVLAAFEDDHKKVVQDDRKDYGETRYNMLAKLNGRIFHITFTPRGTVTWLISARKANQREQKRYEQRS
ncbi:MAG: BrnT family toxin [Rhizobiales bacterium]|jgi:uncharacterized DUF497 family protein|nr:BrnT family toxin [Hyphomicrobiales bacterium]